MKFVSKIMTFDASSVGTDYVFANAYGSTSNRACNPIMTDLFCGKLVEFLTSMGVGASYDSEKKHTYINGVPFLIIVYNKLNYTGTSAGANASPKRSMYKITVESPYSRIAMFTNTATWPTTSSLFSYNECGSILFDELTKTATVKFRFCGTSKNFYFLIGSAAILRRTTANTNSNYFYITETTTTDVFGNNNYCGAFFFFSGKDHLSNKPAVFYGALLNSFTSNNYFFVIEEDDDGMPFEPVSGVVSRAFSTSFYPASYERDLNKYLVNYFLSDGFALDCYFKPKLGSAFPSETTFYSDNTTVFTSNGKNFWSFPYVTCIVDVTEG